MRTGDPGDRRGRPRRLWAPAAVAAIVVAAIVVGAVVVGAVVATSAGPRSSAGPESQAQAGAAAGPYVAVLAPRAELGADEPTSSPSPSAAVVETSGGFEPVPPASVDPSGPAVVVDGSVMTVVNGPQEYLDPATYPPGDGTSGLPGGGAEVRWDGTSVGFYWRKDADQLVVITAGSSTCPVQVSAILPAEDSVPDDQRVQVTFANYTLNETAAAGCANDQALMTTLVQPPAGITSGAPLWIEFDDEVYLPPRGDR